MADLAQIMTAPAGMEQQVEVINSSEALSVIEKAQIDIQVSTAKAYPRNLSQVLSNIETLACSDPETAADCFYCLRRNGGTAPIEGPSIRLAEIIESQWGNIRVRGHIIGDDGGTITARGECWDLETNNATSMDVNRRVTDKYGKRYNEDMVNVTKQAAIAIARRNAVMAVVPKALLSRIFEKIKKVAVGQALDIETSRTNLLANFSKLGVTKEMILFFLGIEDVMKIGVQQIEEMRGAFTAIKEGMTTAQEQFIDPYNQHLKEEELSRQGTELQNAIKEAKQPKQIEATAQQPATEIVKEAIKEAK